MFGTRRSAEIARLNPPPPAKRFARCEPQKIPAIHMCAPNGAGCYIRGDYYTWKFACRRGTFQHTCDESCEFAVPDVSNYVCPISGRRFERILSRTTYSTATNVAESYTVPTFSKREASAPISPAAASAASIEKIGSSAHGVDAHRKTVGVGGKLKSIHLHDVIPILQVLFSRGDCSPFKFDEVVSAYAAELVRLYEFDKGTNLLLHVVGTLYFLKKGITVGGTTCVCPPDPLLTRLLPTSHDLPSVSPSFQRSFITDGNKIWIDVLGSVASRDKGVMRRSARNVQGKRELLLHTKREMKRRRRRGLDDDDDDSSSFERSFSIRNVFPRFGFDAMSNGNDGDADDDDDDDWEEGDDYSATDMSSKAWSELNVFRNHEQIMRASEKKRSYRESRMIEL